MPVRDIFVPAALTDLRTIDPGEIRAVTLTLPDQYEFEGKKYPIRDTMRPGNAFLARPLGVKSGKVRRRMYTRSNCSLNSERSLETIINHTHERTADTSVWWQSEQVEALQREGGTVDIRMVLHPAGTELSVYENSSTCGPKNLRLEPDGEWEHMRFLGVAFSTGITPFLAHLSYMEALEFGRSGRGAGSFYTLIVSVRNPRQLMEHERLLALQRRFPDNFRYYPVLTREWPGDWPYGRGRVVRVEKGNGGEERINLAPLLEVVADPQNYHVRMCGNPTARSQLQKGFAQMGCEVLSFRSEVW